MKISLAQIAPHLGDIQKNFTRHCELIAQAKSEGIDLLVFPELSLTGYTLKDMAQEVARPIQNDPLMGHGAGGGPTHPERSSDGRVQAPQPGHRVRSGLCRREGQWTVL